MSLTFDQVGPETIQVICLSHLTILGSLKILVAVILKFLNGTHFQSVGPYKVDLVSPKLKGAIILLSLKVLGAVTVVLFRF